MDPRVDRAPAAARSGASLRSEHLLPLTRCARVFRAADRAGAHRRPARVARCVAGARAQPRPHSWIRADRVRDVLAGRAMDGRSAGGTARRIRIRVQHAHADPARAHPGHPYLRASTRPLRRRRDDRAIGFPAVAPGAPADRRDGADGLHVRLSRGLRRRNDRGGSRRARGRVVAARARRAAGAGCGLGRDRDARAARLPALSPRRARAAHDPHARERQPVLRDVDGLPRLRGAPALLELERALLSRSGGQLLSRRRAPAAVARRDCRGGAPARPARARRHALRDCDCGHGAVARHGHAALRNRLPSVSTDAGTARRRAIRQLVPARHRAARWFGTRGAA